MVSASREQILDTALAIADATGWERVRLHQIAQRLGISLEAIRLHFPEKEALVDAWFDRADAAMLAQPAPRAGAASPAERLTDAMMAWFDALAPHRRVTRQMIFGKFEPGHVHFQVAGALRVSRTVQWMREAAGCESALPGRAVAETLVTGIYLAGFARWMFDESLDAAATRHFVARQLERAARVPGLLV